MKQIILLTLCLTLCAVWLPACTGNTGENPDTATSATEAPTDTQFESESESDTMNHVQQQTPAFSIVTPDEEQSSFVIMYDKDTDASAAMASNDIMSRLRTVTSATFRVMDATNLINVRQKEIVIGSSSRPETCQMAADLKDGGYAIRAQADDAAGVYKVFIAYKGHYASQLAVKVFLRDCLTEQGLIVPYDYERTGSVNTQIRPMIESPIDCLRDPFIVIVDGTYYAYGTEWVCYRNTSGSLDGDWEFLGKVAENPPTDLGTDHWAPEVHIYNGAYYMFTTYRSTDTGRHGCTILRSESPEGPFVEITGGVITPREWDAIDGTLYVDPEGQPWMVFVREWVSAPNNVGTFAAAKLSEDLTHFVSEPFELFSANEPYWNQGVGLSITDGCWLYTTEEGKLLCLWSNFNADGYVVAVAESSNGRLDGKWIHHDELLYCKAYTGVYDGGHGMIFTDTDGQKYLSFHSPNAAVGNRLEKPVFIPLTERNGKLTWSIFAE